MKNSNVKKLTVSAVFIALATALSFIKLWTNPWGGSVTLLSMLPIVLISVIFGTPWGVFCAFVYSMVQVGVDIGGMMAWGMDARMWFGALVFDYLLAYTVIGIAGMLRKKGTWGICLGTSVALILRFLSHFISGYIFFDIWMPETFKNVAIYSVVYNGTYMLPELITTVIAVFILSRTSTLKRIGDIVNR